jgi:predicted outer membrane repeat protein
LKGGNVVNCLIINNTNKSAAAAYTNMDGGGINAPSAGYHIINCTFSKNSSGGRGGGLNVANIEGEVVNCILWGNIAPSGQWPDIRRTGTTAKVYNSVYGTIHTEVAGENNLKNVNPLWVDPENDNYSLSPASPCKNSGDNTYYLSTYPLVDLAGNSRIADDIVDRGAYESATATGIHVPDTDKMNVSVLNGRLSFEAYGVVDIYAATGVLYKKISASGYTEVALPAGMYIVRAGNRTAKIRI